MGNKCKVEGARAYDSGIERHACPYAAGTVSSQDWTDGWAQQKAQRERENEAEDVERKFAQVG